MKSASGFRFAANLTTIAMLFLIVAVAGCANQPPRSYGACAMGGALLGTAAGAGAGLAIEYNDHSHPSDANRAAAGGGGAAIGAVIGLVLGHELCDPIIPPPPAPQPMATPAPVTAQAPPPPPAPERHRIVLRGVHFAFNKYNIRPEDEAVLDEAVESLKDNPDVAVNVNGYCDAVGSDEYNLKLSQERAEAVVQYLSEHGVAASRLTAHGYGKTNFVATNDNAEGRAQNRRDELVPRE